MSGLKIKIYFDVVITDILDLLGGKINIADWYQIATLHLSAIYELFLDFSYIIGDILAETNVSAKYCVDVILQDYGMLIINCNTKV